MPKGRERRRLIPNSTAEGASPAHRPQRPEMHGIPRRDPDWEHWPGRPTAEDGVRNRLRALFVPTEAEDAITELIAEHGRELEARAEELRNAVVELEQREARARELHARVEQVLREGSAELDIRHSDLAVRGGDLDRREAELAAAESRVEERARAFGAVELRSAAVQRRENALHEREQAFEQREQALRERELAIARKEAAVSSDVAPAADVPDEATPEPAEDSYIAFTLDHGYRLVEQDGAAPAPGDIVELDGGQHRCVRLAASPYPGDRRRCAVLERVQPTAA